MPQADNQSIAKLAYECWQKNGCPQGRDLDHWLQAEQSLKASEGQLSLPSAKSGAVPAAPAS
jgi:hypothetical protein